MLWSSAANDLALVPTEREGMIAMTRARVPRGFSTRQDRCQRIRIRQDCRGQWLVDTGETCLVSQQLAYRDMPLAVLRKLRPVARDGLLILQPTPRMSQGQLQPSEPFVAKADAHPL